MTELANPSAGSTNAPAKRCIAPRTGRNEVISLRDMLTQYRMLAK